MSHIRSEISFNSSSDLFSATQRNLNVSFKAAAFRHELKNEARARQVSNITEQTIISTQYSDDQPGISNSIIEGNVMLHRKLSNNDQDSNIARSRGISGLSGDLNRT